jgi:hypothetical protein
MRFAYCAGRSTGGVMSNRIGEYLDVQHADVYRAFQTLAFCEIIWRMQDDPNALPDWQKASLSKLYEGAVGILRRFGIPYPKHREPYC